MFTVVFDQKYCYVFDIQTMTLFIVSEMTFKGHLNHLKVTANIILRWTSLH